MKRLAASFGALPLGAAMLLTAGAQTTQTGRIAPSAYAAEDIPAAYLADYVRAADLCPGLAWPLLAAIGKVESDHGRDRKPSPAGALGPMQFLPATWARFGVDADGDGRRDPTDPADAIVSAAGYLCALDVARDVHSALVAYNCGNSAPACQAASAGYAADALNIAAHYVAVGDVVSPAALIAVQVAYAQLGTPYMWGGDQPGGFDCSGLVRYAYAAAGIELPRTAQQQFNVGPLLPRSAPIIAGDLLFFGADAAHVHHVGIALDGARMIDAPHAGALVRIDVVGPADPQLIGISRPAATGAAR